MSWPPCLSQRFITPSLRAAFDTLPRRADVETVVAFLADQFVGDFDGLGGEFERLVRATGEDSESDNSGSDSESELRQRERGKVKIEPRDVDTPFRLRVLYLMHSGARTQARKEVEARAASHRPAKRRNRRKTPAAAAARQARTSSQRPPPPSSRATTPGPATPSSDPPESPQFLNSPSSASSSSPLTTLCSSRAPSGSPASDISTSPPPGRKPSKRRRAGPGSETVSVKQPKHSGSTSRLPPGCTPCRALKRRCDREQPCEHCGRTGRECAYPPPPTSTARRRVRQKAKLSTVKSRKVEDSPDSKIDDLPPAPKPVKRHSAPYELKKPQRKYGRMSAVNIDNTLLALLGRPLQPSFPSGRAARKELATPRSNRAEVEEGREETHPYSVDTRGGIRSSTFAAVMRLVVGLGPARATKATANHPAPGRPPPVWAQVSHGTSRLTQSRQELCEALPYYRAFQSGMYMYKHVPFGYLLDGFPSPSATLFISRAS